jgi:hypothetical protein
MNRRQTLASELFLLIAAPKVQFMLWKFRFHIWLAAKEYSWQMKNLKIAMKAVDNKQELESINQPNCLYLAISEVEGSIKLSGFYANSDKEFQKECRKVPGIAFMIISLANLRTQLIDNYFRRKSVDFQREQMAKNGGFYVH